MTTELPRPPRLSSSNPNEAINSLQQWVANVYQVLEQEQRVTQRLTALASIETLDLTVSASPTQAEVQSVVDKVNEVIAAAR